MIRDIYVVSADKAICGLFFILLFITYCTYLYLYYFSRMNDKKYETREKEIYTSFSSYILYIMSQFL